MHKLRGRSFATIALALSVLIGFGMPIGDASAPQAAATQYVAAPAEEASDSPDATVADGNGDGNSNGNGGGGNGGGGAAVTDQDTAGSKPGTDEPSEQDVESSTAPDAAPEAATQPDANGRAAPAPDEAPGFGVFAMPTTEPHMLWEVRANGMLVAGATVEMHGPRTGNPGNGNFGQSYLVTDCTADPCAADSLDQDPTAGKFAVAQRPPATGGPLVPILHTQRFGVRPYGSGAPDGYTWLTSTTDWNDIAAEGNGNNLINRPSPTAWPASTPGYNFGTLELGAGAHLTWSVQDADQNPVGGATVQVHGPRSGDSTDLDGGNWAGPYNVYDCIMPVIEPETVVNPEFGPERESCSPISMDQDPRPGYFSVHTLRAGSSSGFITAPVQQGSRYGIYQFDSPVGHTWASPSENFINIAAQGTGTAAARNAASTTAWPTAQPEYNFGPLLVEETAFLSWSVSDVTSALVGGATVKLEGPRTGGAGAGNWAGPYYVTDCTEIPCHPESMDRDPVPGKFAVESLRGLGGATGTTPTVSDVHSTSRYRIQPMGSIPEHTWVTPTNTWLEIPQSQGGDWNVADWPADQLEFDIGDLKVDQNRAASTFCAAPLQPHSYYSLDRNTAHDASVQRLTHNAAETEIDSGISEVGGISALVGEWQQADSLGVTASGIFYFTGQRIDGTNEDARNVTVYRYDPESDAPPYPVFNMDMLSPTSGLVVSGDATLYQGREEFYFAYYSSSPSNVIIDGRVGLRFHLYRYSHGSGDRTGEVQHIDVPRPANFGSKMDGDIAFDSENNMQFIISDEAGATVAGVVNVDDFMALPSVHTLPEVPTIRGSGQFGIVQDGQINGLAFTLGGKAIIQQTQDNENSFIPLPGLGEREGVQSFAEKHLVDLASCDFPTTITVQKNVVGDRFDESDQFTLGAEREAGAAVEPFRKVTTLGTEPGLQAQQIGPFAMTLDGEFRASEVLLKHAEHYSSSYACHVLDSDGSAKSPFLEAEGTNLSFALSGASAPEDVVAGSNIVCRFTNEALQSKLQVSKRSTPVSDVPVVASEVVNYELVFDNSAGTLPATVNHIDHLSDVLDDADFAEVVGGAPVILVSDAALTATWAVTDEQIDIAGVVPAGASVTVSFAVRVKDNSENAAAREKSPGGFHLNNYLLPAGAQVPSVCEASSSEIATCTVHSVNAWTVEKDSLPANSARLHTGGNVHYTVTAKKMNDGWGGTELDSLELTDDLTHVFKTAGWAPTAATPGGTRPLGVYVLDREGNTLNLDGTPTEPAGQPIRTVATPTQNDEGRWIVTSGEAFNVPPQALTVEMWFAVQAGERPPFDGHPNGLPYVSASEPWSAADGTMPQTGWKFVNYATGTAKTNLGVQASNFAPLWCETGVDVPDVAMAPTDVPPSPADPNFSPECQVQHELSANYFTIRKDAGGQGVLPYADDAAWDPDPTGLWNMVGHEFEVRDNGSSNTATSYSAAQLCRVEYNPREEGVNWNSATGEWIEGQGPAWNGAFSATNDNGKDWAEENPDTLEAIRSWNNAHPAEADQLPVCATLYEIAAGPQAGRWRSESLMAGDYWLLETKGPTQQAHTNAMNGAPRDIPGVQLLAHPVAFKIWPDADSQVEPGSSTHHGRGQLDVSPDGTFNTGTLEDRCSPGTVENGIVQPGSQIADRSVACVNPTGYLLLVKDVAPVQLPFTGGNLIALLTIGGAALLVLMVTAALWRRRQRVSEG